MGRGSALIIQLAFDRLLLSTYSNIPGHPLGVVGGGRVVGG